MQTYNDPAKQRSREKLLDFIRKHLSFRKPKDLRVVCFPGAEIEGEEALEVREVYDRLGIPRQNITGLEQDPKNAERLRKANLGIQVVETDAYSFFSTTTKQFDIVSLDYCGHQTLREYETLKAVAVRKLLRNASVVSLSYSSGREGEDTKFLMGGTYQPEIIRGAVPILEQGDPRAWERRITALPDVRRSIADGTFDTRTARDGITVNSLHALTTGVGNPRLGYADELLKKLAPEVRFASYFPPMPPEDVVRMSFKLICLMSWAHCDNYGTSAVERYSYVSNKNTKMLMDLFLLSYPERAYRVVSGLIFYDVSAEMMVFNDANHRREKYAKLVNSLYDEWVLNEGDFFRFLEKPLSERIDLGSSWDPSKKRKRIARRDALYLLREGVPPQEIVETYGGYTLRQLAAMKAHITMGTYDKKREVD